MTGSSRLTDTHDRVLERLLAICSKVTWCRGMRPEERLKDMYMEREDEMRRVTLNFSHLQSAALSASKSRELIAAIASDLA